MGAVKTKEAQMDIKKLAVAGVVAVGGLFSVGTASADTFVRGHIKQDGTYVAPHFRSDRNGTPCDNWSTKGNFNPYTGREGTRSFDRCVPGTLPSYPGDYAPKTLPCRPGDYAPRTLPYFSNGSGLTLRSR